MAVHRSSFNAALAELKNAGLSSEAWERFGHGNPCEPRLEVGGNRPGHRSPVCPGVAHTVGSLEYPLGRVDAAMELFLGLAALEKAAALAPADYELPPANLLHLEECLKQKHDSQEDRT